MPFFSKRKQGKQKVYKHGSGKEGSKTSTSEKVKQQDFASRQTFNGVSTTPDIQRKDLLKACQRSSNSTAKCVANFPRRSRLSKSLPEVLVDDSILPLFLEFLQKQGAQNVLNFWLAAETFRLSSRDKKLPSYKSRLKLKPNQEFSSNTTMFDSQNNSKHVVPSHLFPLERCEQSNQINLMQLQTFGPNSSNASMNDNSRNISNSGNLALKAGASRGMNSPGSSEDSCTSWHSRSSNRSATSTEFTSPFRTIETEDQNDSNNRNPCKNCSGSPSMHNSTNSSRTSPSHDALFDNSLFGSALPISAGLSTSTDHSLSSVASVSGSNNVKSSEMLNYSNNRTENECSSNSSECGTSFENAVQIQGKLHRTSASKIEPCSDGQLPKNEIAIEMCRSLEKNKLLRQESIDTKERRRMSKILMDDAISIYRHFISLESSQPLGVDENIRREVESNICTENGVIDPDCFHVAQKFAFDTLQNRYFDDFARSSYYQKHIMDILTSGKVFLADIMYNDGAMFYFMEFMEQEEKSYLLAFWFAVDSFCQELQSKLDKKEYNAEEALDDAMVLYNKYFSMQASNSLGVSDETRIRIENKICREGGPLPECFEEPMENVLTLLEEVYFPIFLESSVYMKYLNELFSSVTDVDPDQTSTYNDDCSSTASGSETSKLMESLVNDVEAHEDPDEIWQRPHFGLSIGRVNEFGIYEPGIEPQPGKEALKFGQKMKKLVSGDSEKVKEEMAWKVAKMVLEDVKKQQGKLKR